MNKEKLGTRFMFAVMILTVVFFFYTGAYEKSSLFPEFPVPKGAELIKSRTGPEARHEEYQWSRASEENGLPFSYLLIIRLWGWKEAEIMGSLTAFEKDGQKVEVISQTNYLSLSAPIEERRN